MVLDNTSAIVSDLTFLSIRRNRLDTSAINFFFSICNTKFV